MDSSNGMGCLSVVQIVLVILKLTELISWSWWLVLTPVWIWLGLFLLVLILGVIALSVSNDEEVKRTKKDIDEIWNGKHGEDN
ncbi:hypothetical protein [Tetragenococcus halophilus]|uniref:hypothetical protein n=1 Tax=Tetragenococcus halophilus TaxID=51669 RepID=UPI00209B4E85|nr:hypothetical protein [Tetragenococcus halophilus]MCO8294896.1 transmembrane Fragile-X-F protein [Tetragenococcus halophilus]